MGRKIIPLKDEYYDWLVNHKLGGDVMRKYTKLCSELQDKAFKWFVPNDDNRCEDGLRLRDEFIEAKRLDEKHLEVKYFLRSPCTVLEVLVALSNRISYEMFDLKDQKNHNARWFLEMVTNLGLDVYTDSTTKGDILDEMDAVAVDDRLETLMDRTYAYDGSRGGLFPLKKRPPSDQRNVEIWYQLMLYLDENYG